MGGSLLEYRQEYCGSIMSQPQDKQDSSGGFKCLTKQVLFFVLLRTVSVIVR